MRQGWDADDPPGPLVQAANAGTYRKRLAICGGKGLCCYYFATRVRAAGTDGVPLTTRSLWEKNNTLKGGQNHHPRRHHPLALINNPLAPTKGVCCVHLVG